MTQNVAKTGEVVFPAVVAAATGASGSEVADRRPDRRQAEDLARYRLVIEGEPVRGFVYKSVDRLTGEVVSEYPRETVLKLKSDPGYVEGAVIDTTA